MTEEKGKRGYYEVLSISKEATSSEIKSAYRALAKKYHPDLCSDTDAEEKFRELSEAYEVLIDEDKRKEYDRIGQEVAEDTFGPKGFTWTKFTRYKDIEDIYPKSTFEVFLKRERTATRGSDIRVDLVITLEECAHGVKKIVDVPYTNPCEHCGGTGSEDMKFDICTYCKGEGQLKNIQGYGRSQVINLTLCMNCEGTGRIVVKKCSMCRGSGTFTQYNPVSVKTPPGAVEGYRIRIPGWGEKGMNGGQDGSLYVVVRVKQHENFNFLGRDIYADLPLTFTNAALGIEVIVKTLWGESKIKIPTGTQQGEVFKLKGQGLPSLYDVGSRGDHIARVVIKGIPKNLSSRQRKLLQEFARLSEEEENTVSNSEKINRGLFKWK